MWLARILKVYPAALAWPPLQPPRTFAASRAAPVAASKQFSSLVLTARPCALLGWDQLQVKVTWLTSDDHTTLPSVLLFTTFTALFCAAQYSPAFFVASIRLWPPIPWPCALPVTMYWLLPTGTTSLADAQATSASAPSIVITVVVFIASPLVNVCVPA